MEHLVYLDQNVLSDLRPRKLEQSRSKNLSLIFKALRSPQVRLIYSFVHHREISQISKPEYQQEHIALFEQLNTAFIEALTMKLDYRRPSVLWAEHLENEDLNDATGVTTCADGFSLLGRKLSGLPVDQSFEGIAELQNDSIREMLEPALQTLCEMELNELPEDVRKNIESIRKLKQTLQNIDFVKPLPIDDSQTLGPRPFRDWENIKQLNIESLSSGEVIPKLTEVFTALNPDKRWGIEGETVGDQISQCYWLMNWANYHADDIDNPTNKKDRFNASNNDMMHAQMAASCHFLISNDNAFRMKVKACYEHLQLPVVVCTAKEFARNHCVINDA